MYGIDPKNELKIFNQNLMDKVKVSNADYYQIIRTKKHSAQFSHVQYNHLSGVNYIGLDCDHDVFTLLDDKNINPNLVVINKNNNKAHLFFRLSSFVGTTANSKVKPQRALRLLTHSLNNYLGTDRGFNGIQAKNPLHSDFRVMSFANRPWDFTELFDNIPDEQIYVNKPRVSTQDDKEIIHVGAGERNVYLFDAVRFQSYKIKHKHNNFNDFYEEVEKIYIELNTMLAEPIDFKECQHSIKSIATWGWYNFVGDNKNRGVLELDSKGHNLTLQDKQVLGSQYVAKTKREKTEQLIVEAINILQANGKKTTKKAISELAGVHRNTLRNYTSLLIKK